MSLWPLQRKEEIGGRLCDWQKGQGTRASNSHQVFCNGITCSVNRMGSVLEKSHTPAIPRSLLPIGLQSKFCLHEIEREASEMISLDLEKHPNLSSSSLWGAENDILRGMSYFHKTRTCAMRWFHTL